jgi:hypothetical protein
MLAADAFVAILASLLLSAVVVALVGTGAAD